MSINKDVADLIKADIITQETADKIIDYYKEKSTSSTSRLFIVFGILGAILVGLGIILIIAHNWDELSRTAKTCFAFLPLLVGQVLCAYTLLKKQSSVAWRDSTAVFLFFGVGASTALVSQIYNIPGDTAAFLFTWMLLCLALVYLMNSSVTSLLYLGGITWYAAHLGYWSYPRSEPYLYWLLLLAVLPHYYNLYRKRPESSFIVFHHWVVPLSVVIVLGTISKDMEELMFIAYISLFGLFYLVGNSEFFNRQKARDNGYKIVGFLGTISMLLALSFDWFWEDLRRDEFQLAEAVAAPEFFAAAIISVLAGVLLVFHQKNKVLIEVNPLAVVFVLFIVTFIIGLTSPVAVVLINLFVLTIVVFIIMECAKQDHLGLLNVGLLVITALVVCRFFDSDLSFVIRGLLFVGVGGGFFVTNYWMLKKRKTNEQ